MEKVCVFLTAVNSETDWGCIAQSYPRTMFNLIQVAYEAKICVWTPSSCVSKSVDTYSFIWSNDHV